MTVCSLPKIGDIYFLMHKKIKIVRVYSLFHLVVVRNIDTLEEFCVDMYALSPKPNYTNSLSLKLIRVEWREKDYGIH